MQDHVNSLLENQIQAEDRKKPNLVDGQFTNLFSKRRDTISSLVIEKDHV